MASVRLMMWAETEWASEETRWQEKEKVRAMRDIMCLWLHWLPPPTSYSHSHSHPLFPTPHSLLPTLTVSLHAPGQVRSSGFLAQSRDASIHPRYCGFIKTFPPLSYCVWLNLCMSLFYCVCVCVCACATGFFCCSTTGIITKIRKYYVATCAAVFFLSLFFRKCIRQILIKLNIVFIFNCSVYPARVFF